MRGIPRSVSIVRYPSKRFRLRNIKNSCSLDGGEFSTIQAHRNSLKMAYRNTMSTNNKYVSCTNVPKDKATTTTGIQIFTNLYTFTEII